MAFFKIKGIPGLEGLVVEAEYRSVGDVLCILEIINPNAVVGDRTVRFPIPEGKLFVDDAFVQEIEDPGVKEFSTKSPFGTLLFEGQLRKDSLIVDYVQYDNAVTVTIREDHGEKGRTVYTQNFFNKKASAAMTIVQNAVIGTVDVDELVFDLKELHTRKE